MLPNVINQAIAASVALARIKSFLLAPALTRGGVNTAAKIGEVAVRVDKSSFSWSKASGVALRDVELALQQGEVSSSRTTLSAHITIGMLVNICYRHLKQK